MRGTLRSIRELLKETARTWNRDGAPRMGAAVAFYATLSAIPLAILTLRVVGLIFSERAARDQVFNSLQNVVGPEAASTMQDLILTAAQSGPAVGTTIIGVLILAVAASNLFSQIRSSLNTMWEFTTPRSGLGGFLAGRAVSLLLTFGVGLLLLVLFALSGVLSAAVEVVAPRLPLGESSLLRAADALITFAGVFLLVGAIYKILPRGNLPWGVIGVGASVTAVLFLIGKVVLGLYLGFAPIDSVYGAAGSLLVVLIWFFYIAQVFYFGVAFTKVYERRRRERAGESRQQGSEVTRAG
ncbi:MAG: YihY/virulence factor BrkB family protein [bacterium]